MAAADVDRAVTQRRVTSETRARFQAVALLLREQRSEARTAPMSEVQRTAQMKRIDGLAVALARTAARDTSLYALLADDTPLLPGTSTALRELRVKSGLDVGTEVVAEPQPETTTTRDQRQVVPQSAIARNLVNPFLAPDFSAAPAARPKARLLADWELIRPLLRAFEESTADAPSCMTLPDPRDAHIAAG